MEQITNNLASILIPLLLVVGFWPGASWSLGSSCYNIAIKRMKAQGYEEGNLNEMQKKALKLLWFGWVVVPFAGGAIVLPITSIRLILCLMGFDLC